MKTFKIGIIGAGHIAIKMANTIHGMEGVEAYAIASRDYSKACAFANEHRFTRAYGSYEELMDDDNVQLIYIATPHSHHYEQAKACLLKGKPVLCEKAFTATAWQAAELLYLSKERNVFIAEAIWTRYLPLLQTVKDIVASNIIGEPKMLSANLGYPVRDVERIIRPELAGGALLDLGVYTLNFAVAIFGSSGIGNVRSSCLKTNSGIDAQESITLTYNDGRMAVLHNSVCVRTDRQGIISGANGHIIVHNCNNLQKAVVVDADYNVIAEYDAPHQITGFEYQVSACMEAINNGWIETPYMPHSETLLMMLLMDKLRKDWGVKYPWDEVSF